MGISVDWGNPDKTIITYNIKGKWNWLDMEAGLQQSIIMTFTVSHVVHEIYDLQYSQPFPDESINFWRNVLRVMPENRGYMIFVGGGNPIASLISMLGTVAPTYVDQLQAVDKMPQAHRLITYLENKSSAV